MDFYFPFSRLVIAKSGRGLSDFGQNGTRSKIIELNWGISLSELSDFLSFHTSVLDSSV